MGVVYNKPNWASQLNCLHKYISRHLKTRVRGFYTKFLEKVSIIWACLWYRLVLIETCFFNSTKHWTNICHVYNQTNIQKILSCLKEKMFWKKYIEWRGLNSLTFHKKEKQQKIRLINSVVYNLISILIYLDLSSCKQGNFF